MLDGFYAAGKPKLRAPKRDITTRMLMLHTAGFGYDFFNENYNRLASEHGQPSVITASKASIMTPLLFDPGDRWEYGTNLDWCGQVVEGIRSKRLGEVMRERDLRAAWHEGNHFCPHANDASAVGGHASARGRRLAYPTLQFRAAAGPRSPDGWSRALFDRRRLLPFHSDVVERRGGENGRVLNAETVCAAVVNGLGDMKIKMLPGVVSSLSNDAEFFPGMPKSWCYTFMINDEEAPTGRPAGALGWAGLANLFYWIDRKNGLGGYWATQILPFGDPVSFTGYMDFETAAYQSVVPNKAA